MDKRRIILICSAGVTACAALLILAVIFIMKYSDSKALKHEGIVNKVDVEVTVPPAPTEKTNIVRESSSSMEDIITSQTEYTLQTFYVNTDSTENLVEDTYPVPSEIITMNKTELQSYLKSYIEDMPLNEYLDGLLSYEIIDFTNKHVTLRKTYASDWKDNDYYVCDVNGEVVVYYSDKKTVFEYTGLMTEDLEGDEQVRVRIGYFVSDLDELYALLESYSS